nr:MAG TPA: hypothetical protein [Caudoviricetes sp.]
MNSVIWNVALPTECAKLELAEAVFISITSFQKKIKTRYTLI